MKRLAYIGLVVAVPVSVVARSEFSWNRLVGLLNGGWPPWVGNVANVLQIITPIVALASWFTRTARCRRTERGDGGSARVLRYFALLLPARDRERFVREVVANMADRPQRWQRLRELLSWRPRCWGWR